MCLFLFNTLLIKTIEIFVKNSLNVITLFNNLNMKLFQTLQELRYKETSINAVKALEGEGLRIKV